MEYNLKHQDRSVVVTADTEGDNALKMTIGESAFQVSYTRTSDNHLYLDIDDGTTRQGINVYTAQYNGGKWIVMDGIPFYVEDLDNQTASRLKKSGDAGGPNIVTPPMPAIVIAVPVAEGESVTRGQKVVVLSAMKMETTLTAPFDGTVVKVNVKEGDKVAPGDILVDIDKEAS